MSKKRQTPKPEGYDELLADIVSLIRQFKAKTGVKVKPAQPAKKNAATPKPRKKPGGRK